MFAVLMLTLSLWQVKLWDKLIVNLIFLNNLCSFIVYGIVQNLISFSPQKNVQRILYSIGGYIYSQ